MLDIRSESYRRHERPRRSIEREERRGAIYHRMFLKREETCQNLVAGGQNAGRLHILIHTRFRIREGLMV
jgi:hypothetical protein